MPISEQLRAVRAKLGHDLSMLPAVTGLVFDDAGRVLLQKHGDTLRWVALGGSVEPAEQPLDALGLAPWARTMLPVAFANRGRSSIEPSPWAPSW